MNFNIDYLKLEGFLSIGLIEINLKDQGLVLVSGRNESNSSESNSNGSGKSSIFEGIIWILTGSTVRGIRDKDIINSYYENHQTYGELRFSVDETSYIVIRTRDHHEYGTCLKFFIDGDDFSGKGIKDSESIIQARLPFITYNLLSSVIVLGQGLPNRFTSLSPAGRKDRLEELTQSSQFIDSLKSRISIRRSELSQMINDISRKISNLEGQKTSELSQQTSLTNTILSYDPDKVSADLVTDRSRLVEIENNKKILEDKIKMLSLKSDELGSLQLEYNGIIGQLSTNLSVCQSKLVDLSKDVCPTCHRPFKKTDEDLRNIQDLKNQSSKIQMTISQINSKISLVSDKTKIYRSKALEIQSRINALMEEKTRLSSDISSKNSLVSQIDKMKSDLNKISSEISTIDSEIENLNIQKLDKSNHLSAVDFLFQESSKGFRGYLLKNSIDYLDKRSKYYAEKLGGSSIDVSLEASKIPIRYEERDYESLSGGEKQRTDLAVQFSLRDMLMTVSGFSCNILILDEVFDNLDLKGAENLISMISSTSGSIDSVFIITHHSDISIPYDNTINIVKNSSGVSYIE